MTVEADERGGTDAFTSLLPAVNDDFLFVIHHTNLFDWLWKELLILSARHT